MLNEALGWIRQGLRPRAITRDLPWGVPVPLPRSRRTSTLRLVRCRDPLSVELVEWWVAQAIRRLGESGIMTGTSPSLLPRHGNAPFHAVWWPAILAGSDPSLHLPDDLVVNHYLTAGSKMSASRGVGFTVKAGIRDRLVDGLRHTLCSLNPERADVEFTWEHAAELRRTGLLGPIANQFYRVSSLLWTRYDGRTDAQAWADALSDATRLGRGTSLSE